MNRKFKPKQTAPLESVYITQDSKEWVRTQAELHKVSMVSVIDEMVHVCKDIAPKQRPNVLRPKEEK